MTSRIWKYPLALTPEAEQVLMPKDAAILCAGVDAANRVSGISVWALVNPNEQEKVARYLRVYPTGYADVDADSIYIGTVFLSGFVWHVFEAVVWTGGV